MACETFNRYEKKYRISEECFQSLQEQIAEHMDLDPNNQGRFCYPICNIYYDTADSDLIRHSISKPVYKEKLRLRSYGTPTAGSTVYAEIKKKYKGLTNKRRSGLKLDEAYSFLDTGKLPVCQPYMNSQILKEIQYMLSQMELRPALYLSYQRRAFLQGGDSDLRVSFDTDIVSRRYDLRLESGSYGEALLAPGVWLMEVKTAYAIPIWLTKLLSEHQIFPSGFSKYGAEYQSMLAGRE
jgi:hypothetical protein